MKILLVTGSLPPMRCGVGDYTWKLAEALARQGSTVGVLTSLEGRASGEAAPEGAPGIVVFPVMPHWRVSAARSAWRVLRRWRPDIVHVQYPTQGYGDGRLPSFLPLLARLAGARVVRTWHEIPSGAEKTFLLQAAVPGDYVVTRQAFGEGMPSLARRLLARSRRTYVPIASNIPVVALSDEERRAVRGRYDAEAEGRRLIAYFGFLYRFKGADQLFDICDPEIDRLVFVGDADVDRDYTDEVAARAGDPTWAGKATLAGYLSESEIARHLAAADAVVLPFRRGGGIGNGTIHAAVLQGTPVVTTSHERQGLDAADLVYYARPDDVADMRRGLDEVAGRRRPVDGSADRAEWDRMAEAHGAIYARGTPVAGSAA